MNRRELLLGAVAVSGGGYALWDTGILSAPDAVERATSPENSGESPKQQRSEPEDPDDSELTATKSIQDIPRMVHEEVNRFRKNNDRNALRWSPALAQMAEDWADRMAQRSELQHRDGSLVNTANSFGKKCDQAGENIAQSWMNERIELSSGKVVEYTTPDEMATGLVTQWANSPGHRENMLRIQYSDLGVGVVVESDGKVWAVQNFC